MLLRRFHPAECWLLERFRPGLWYEGTDMHDDVTKWKTFSALLALCEGNSPVTGEFPSQKPVTRSFDVFVDLRLNKQLYKESSRRWSETPSRSLWRHFNVIVHMWYWNICVSFPISRLSYSIWSTQTSPIYIHDNLPSFPLVHLLHHVSNRCLNLAWGIEWQLNLTNHHTPYMIFPEIKVITTMLWNSMRIFSL